MGDFLSYKLNGDIMAKSVGGGGIEKSDSERISSLIEL